MTFLVNILSEIFHRLEIQEYVIIYERSCLDSIAVSLFGIMTVEPREIYKITKEYQNKRSK